MWVGSDVNVSLLLWYLTKVMYREMLKCSFAVLLWLECHSLMTLGRNSTTKITWSTYLTFQIYTRKWDKAPPPQKKEVGVEVKKKAPEIECSSHHSNPLCFFIILFHPNSHYIIKMYFYWSSPSWKQDYLIS